ncbi:MAG: CDP-alcohol phosphatidyltransferase family protein [Ktedonobacteraceae bacterium]|nr:CDP-alcohol phosphatidyltransferase family protein [Ktedonobacteraceae bacterium]
MQRQKHTLSSIYSEEEARILNPWQNLRQRLLLPVAQLLVRLGISPDILSYSSVLFCVGFFLLAPLYYTIAFWLLIASVICDGLDGVEARLIGKNTARGGFTDMFCDQTGLVFVVAGMAWRNALNPVLALFFVYVYTALVIFLLLHQLLQVSSRWIIRPSRMLFYCFIALDFFFNINLLNALLTLYLLALPLLALSFWRLRNSL